MAVTDGPGGGQLYLNFDDDRENIAVDPANLRHGEDAIHVTVDDETFEVPPGYQDCCDACDCFGRPCYYCPGEPL